jgi:UDP-glucuronate decarboxylase
MAKEFDSPVNLGNPREMTMHELAEVVMTAAGKPLRLERRPLPADDPKRRCPDITKAKRLLGFEPRVTLEQGIRATYDDFQARMRARPPNHSR